MKILNLILFIPIFLFSQQDNDWSFYMRKALDDIKKEDFKSAKINLEKSIELDPKNPAPYYFKGFSEIIMNQEEQGCKSLIESIYLNFNHAKQLYAEKCLRFNPKLNIQNFRTGKYELMFLDNSFYKYEIERKNDIQFEKYEGKIYSGKLVWLGDGDYTIIADEKTEKELDKNPKFYTRVLKIEGDEYLYIKIEENQVAYGIIKKLQ